MKICNQTFVYVDFNGFIIICTKILDLYVLTELKTGTVFVFRGKVTVLQSQVELFF